MEFTFQTGALRQNIKRLLIVIQGNADQLGEIQQVVGDHLNADQLDELQALAEEKASLELTCKLLNLSLSTFIRRAIHNVKIEKTIIVAGGGEETLTAVSTLLAQCSKVGGNLNQLARHFNSGGADTEQIRAKILDELADLTAFRLHAEKVLGELYGNAQAYRLSRKGSCIVQP